MSSDLFPAPTVRRCASQRAPRSPNSNGEQVLRLTGSCHSLWSSSPSLSSSSSQRAPGHSIGEQVLSFIVIIIIFRLRTEADWFYNYLNVKPSALTKWMIIVKMIATGCQKKEDCSRDKQRATKAEVTIVSFLNTWSFFWLLALLNVHQYHINREKSRKLPLPRWLFLACAFQNLAAATQKPKTLQITASNAKKSNLMLSWINWMKFHLPFFSELFPICRKADSFEAFSSTTCSL